MKLGKGARIILAVVVAAMTVTGLSGLIFLIPDRGGDLGGSVENIGSAESKGMETISLTASDGVNIVADYYKVDNPYGLVVYAHMMPSTRSSFSGLARRLQRVGYAGLALDLRGHGESEGGPDGYKNFNDSQHQASLQDIVAAVEFLRGQGFENAPVVLVGASIGANLIIEYASQHSDVVSVVALSPGTNYHGILASSALEKLQNSQRVFIAGSEDDSNVIDNAGQIASLIQLLPDDVEREIEIYERGGHGTDILKNQPSLEDKIVAFIVQ